MFCVLFPLNQRNQSRLLGTWDLLQRGRKTRVTGKRIQSVLHCRSRRLSLKPLLLDRAAHTLAHPFFRKRHHLESVRRGGQTKTSSQPSLVEDVGACWESSLPGVLTPGVLTPGSPRPGSPPSITSEASKDFQVPLIPTRTLTISHCSYFKESSTSKNLTGTLTFEGLALPGCLWSPVLRLLR